MVVLFVSVLGFASMPSGAEPLFGPIQITHGPIVGGVTHSSAEVMLRTDAEANVRLLYSTDPTFRSDRHLSGPATAVAANDLTAHVELDNLEPATTYHFKVLVNVLPANLRQSNQFKTAPTPDSDASFTFAIFSDLSTRSRPAMAYASAAQDDPQFALMIGDFDHRAPGIFPVPITIWNWRVMHRQVLGDWAAGQDFAAHIAPRIPVFPIWDDHDYGADNSDRTAPWKDLATQAFMEYHPLPPLANPDAGLWYSFRYAQAEFFMLDLRSQRDPNNQPDGPGKSMLDGDGLANDQKSWLVNALLTSTARWKFVISSSVWNPNSKQVDSWYLFQSEQQELIQFIKDNLISGVIILSGDMHSGGAIDDGTNSTFPELNVPTVNISQARDCTGGYCGQWSEGIIVGSDPSGYGLVHVVHQPLSGMDHVALEARAEDGTLRLRYTVDSP